MARIPILSEDDPTLPEATRELLREAGAARGRLINIYRAMANRPEALSAFTTMLTTVYRKDSTLPPKQAELAYLTATTVNNCFY